MKNLDVKHINPFLQSSLSIVESTTQIKLSVGRPGLSELSFENSTFILQIGVTGALKGQVLIVMTEENAKKIASAMMMGMPMDTIDDMAVSALSELGNMIMGNTATIFSTQGILMDITPPLTMQGSRFKMQTDAQVLNVPLKDGEETLINLYLCVGQED